MQAISRFVRTTIFGGVLFLTPIVVIWLILSKAYNLAGRVLLPLTALIPDSLSSRTTITAVLESPVDRARLLPCWALRPHNAGAEDRARTRSVRTLQGPRLRIYEAGRREHARRRRDGGLFSHTRQSRRRMAHWGKAVNHRLALRPTRCFHRRRRVQQTAEMNLSK